MQWIAPPEKDIATKTLEKRLWAAADRFRANSGLTSAQYSQPALGLIFLRFASVVRGAADKAVRGIGVIAAHIAQLPRLVTWASAVFLTGAPAWLVGNQRR